jgi:hypothetical protein
MEFLRTAWSTRCGRTPGTGVPLQQHEAGDPKQYSSRYLFMRARLQTPLPESTSPVSVSNSRRATSLPTHSPIRLWAAPSSFISRSPSQPVHLPRSKLHSASPRLHHDRPSQPSICTCPAQGQPSSPGYRRQLIHCLPTVLNPLLPGHRRFSRDNTQMVLAIGYSIDASELAHAQDTFSSSSPP